MKISKILLILLVSLAVVSCKKDDDSKSSFLLSNTNLAGDHDLIFLEGTVITSTEVQGVPVTATTTVKGDTFQTVFMIDDNGTFTVNGQYRVVTTVTVAGQTETDSEIIVVDDSGSYSIDANDEIITFTGVDGFSSTFDVTLFNENEIRLESMETEVQGDATSEITTEIRLRRQ